MEYQEIERSIIKKFRKKLWCRFARGVEEYNLVQDGDKIAVCISGGKDSFILFINPNETPKSKLYYELMMANRNVNIIKEEVFEAENRFGFAAIIQNGEESFELVTSIGGMKLTTISSEKNIASNLNEMMTIIRSIQTQ